MVATYLLVSYDFNKAFAKVDYWLLFCKLLEFNNSVPCFYATCLLARWYSCQMMSVWWQGVNSAFFNIAKGVCQGRILSLFTAHRFASAVLATAVLSVCHTPVLCQNNGM